MTINDEKLTVRNRIILTALIGLVTFLSSIYISRLTGLGPGDLRYSAMLARDWLAGKNPYLPFISSATQDIVPYPFTGILVSMPLILLPDHIAAAVFISLGTMLLAWLIMKNGQNWQLLMLASWPFVNSLIFTQWSPYLVSMYFTPNLLPLLIIKPQMALPFTFTQKPSRIGIILTVVLAIVSLILFPNWPAEWLKTLRTYIGYPPLFVLPFGPLLVLALLRYRNKRSWLLILMALMPQRMVYDQLGVLLVAENRKQMLILVLWSWITLPILVLFGGWNSIPFGWQQWVLIGSYLPALLVFLSPIIADYFVKLKVLLSRPGN